MNFIVILNSQFIDKFFSDLNPNDNLVLVEEVKKRNDKIVFMEKY